ncbi:MAG TPA: heme o synthase [Kofleriaceae bacterium]|nr:heme o synthase [Kofleriaceae bacterium]
MTTRALATKTFDLVALVKPRIMTMALLTAAGALRLAPVAIGAGHAIVMLAGTALIVGAANTLNMLLERDTDCLMSRTKNRPLPQHRLTPRTALVFGAAQGAIALPVLAIAGIVPAALGLLALLLYVGAYTPMKQRTHWATWIGAVPGAMPALIGWTAATGRIDLGGLSVFAVLLLWQIPHTHAIAIYRQREYDAAGLKTLAGTHGVAAARRAIVIFLFVQVAASLVPALLGVAGLPYLATATVLGAAVVTHGINGDGSARWARQVFVASIVYLPILFGVMVAGGHA